MTWFTDSIYERLMTEKPKCGRPEKEPPASFPQNAKTALTGESSHASGIVSER